jgi:hypothetical protein
MDSTEIKYLSRNVLVEWSTLLLRIREVPTILTDVLVVVVFLSPSRQIPG